MEKRKIRYFFPVLLVITIIACMSFFAACGNPEGGEDNTSDVTLSAESFTNDVATVVVDGDRKITVVPSSDFIELSSTGAFTVKVGDADAVESAENKVSLDNAAVDGTPMTMTVHTDGKLEITFKLVTDYTSDVVLNPSDFTNDDIAAVNVNGDRKVTIVPLSDDVEFTSTGAFSVKVGETVTQSTNNTVTIENTSDTQVRMTVTLHSDTALTIAVKLKYDLGTEENPYAVSAEEPTEVACGEEAWIDIAESGWYVFASSSDVTVTNYAYTEYAHSNMLYLAAGKYSLGSESDEATVTITPAAEAPVGYSSDAAVWLDTGDRSTGKLKIYDGMACVFAFTAEETGVYEFALGTDGISPNARFTTDFDAEGTYYGKYFDASWKSYASSKAVFALKKDESITITVDYTNDLIGNDDVSLSVAEYTTVTEIVSLDQNAEAALTAGGKLYFSFAAPQRGKFTFNLGNGVTSAVCRYTVSGDDTVYNKESSATVLLASGEKAILTVDCADSAVNGTVQINGSQTFEEDFPTDWVSGDFECIENGMLLSIDITQKQVVYKAYETATPQTLHLYYLDGVAEFTVPGAEKQIWDLTRKDGKYILKKVGRASLESKEYVLTVPAAPVAINKWTGVYTSETGIDGDKKLTIYEDGNGYIGVHVYSYAYYSNNVLQWDSDYELTIKALSSADGSVAEISVKKNDGDPVDFTKTEDAVVVLPKTLPLQTEKYMSAAGEVIIVSESAEYQTLQTKNDKFGYKMTIYGYDESNNTYNVVCSGVKYILKLTLGTGDLAGKATQIEVCDEEGTTLDTIVVYKPVLDPKAFVADGTTENACGYADEETSAGSGAFKTGIVNDEYTFFKAPDTGWYKITCTVEICVGATQETPDSGKAKISLGEKISLTEIVPTESDYIYIEKDEWISVHSVTATFTATVTETAPTGFAASNPFAMTDGAYEFATGKAYGYMTYYVSFIAAEEATYEIRLSSSGKMTVETIEYGTYYDAALWKNVPYAGGEFYSAAFTAGQSVTIAVSLVDTKDSAVTITATKKVAELFTADQIGTYEGKNNFDDSAKLTINSDFTVDYVNSAGEEYKGLSVTKSGITYTFTYSVPGWSDSQVTFEFTDTGILLNDGDDFELTKPLFTADQIGEYSYGDEFESLTLTINSDFTVNYYYSINSETKTGLTVTKDGANYKFSYEESGSNYDVTFIFNGANIELTDGNTYTLKNGAASGDEEVTFTSDQLGTYSGNCDGYTYVLTLSNVMEEITFNDGSSTYSKPTVTKSGDTYTVEFPQNGPVAGTTITFSFNGDGSISLTDTYGTWTLPKIER